MKTSGTATAPLVKEVRLGNLGLRREAALGEFGFEGSVEAGRHSRGLPIVVNEGEAETRVDRGAVFEEGSQSSLLQRKNARRLRPKLMKLESLPRIRVDVAAFGEARVRCS
ncbi:hypothetical protein MLD38_037846 [Melastoma candidum]|uniref:Uncharacterized protein n=1 Tax=Melastoma candidum TaxID=119954 RepID=A0ACB9LP86_9MYRT|nr:hypothetical protein MLD38_037846 [Melastoma candidum]